MASFTSLLTNAPIPTPLSTAPRPSTCLHPLRRAPKPITVECSSRPQKKATAHHAKTRPKKHALWDKKRRPTVYPPLPPFPPEWTLVESAATGSAAAAEEPTAAE